MRLVSFSVTNFRSITTAHKIPIGDSTVLIGKNNEGKSNLLRALNLSMRALTAHAGESQIISDIIDGPKYLWRRDFPISLQDRTSTTDSIFRLEFSLDENEIHEFRREIKSSLNGTLPIEIKFGKSNLSKIHVPKRGRGGNTLSAKSAKIAKYIAQRIQFNYIPAIRTEDEALAVVQAMLSTELTQLETNPDYLAALQKISDLQQPILDNVAQSIKNSLKLFLPDITDVVVRIPSQASRSALRNQCKIEIDDGSLTDLEFKGDGVKSLAALGLLKDKRKMSGASIIAIEEPESHLHPGAMHSLREIIKTLTTDNQVVITTHCPLFVDRESISRNILIDRNSARPAKEISMIRKTLGVRASDNLVNASHVLVVEGETDIISITALLSHISPAISKALKQHRLVIEKLGGSAKLSYKLSLLSQALCVTHVLLDYDDAGRTAYEKACQENMLSVLDTTFIRCDKMKESELEDCFETTAYISEVKSEFGVNLDDSAFLGNRKWSERAESCFAKQGKPWDAQTAAKLKAVVAKSIAKNPDFALNPERRNSIDALVTALEIKLQLVTENC